MLKMKTFFSLFLVIALILSSATGVFAYSAEAENVDLPAMAGKIEAATYKAYDAEGETAAAAKAKAEALVAELLTGSGITATVNDSTNAPAFIAAETADCVVQPTIDGKYKFTVTLSDGAASQTTRELSLNITLTPEGCNLKDDMNHLVNVIGPRISGTVSEFAATAWAEEQYKKIDGGDNIYIVGRETYMLNWVPAKGIQMNPANLTQYGYLFTNHFTQHGVIEADVPSGAAAIGLPVPNSASFRDFDGESGLYHDFGVYNAATSSVSSTPAESAVIAAGGKIYGSLRFDRAVTGTMINAAIANIRAAYTTQVDVTGLFVARYDNTRTNNNPVGFTYNDIPLSVSSYTNAATSVIGLTLTDLEKTKAAGEAGKIGKVYRIVPEWGSVAYARKPAADPDNPDLVIAFTSHIDTVRGSPGAQDTATGVSTFMELMRRFKDVDTGNIELIFCAQGSEEYNDFSGSTHMINKLYDEGKNVVTINFNLDISAANDGATNVLGEPVNTWAVGTHLFQERYQYPNFRNANYGDNLGTATSAFNLASHLISSYAKDVDWPLNIKNVRIFNWGASDHATWAYFGMDSMGLRSAARDGNHSISSSNVNVYGHKYHSALDNMDDYNYESHLKLTNLMANAIQKAIDMELTKRAKFFIDDKDGTVKLQNAAQLFKTYDAVRGVFKGPKGDIPFMFTPDVTVIKLANAKDYEVANLTAFGMGIGNHNAAMNNAPNGIKEFVTTLAPQVVNVDNPDSLTLTSDKARIIAGDQFTLTAAFENKVESNAGTLTYTFDPSIFNYIDFAPANGVTLVNSVITNGQVKLTLVRIGDYGINELGSLTLQAKEDAVFNGELKEFSVNAQYVLNTDPKTIASGTAFTTVRTVEIGDFTLIDLSNIVDWFGIDNTDANWFRLYAAWDFNNNGEIDIYDIVFVAMLIKD